MYNYIAQIEANAALWMKSGRAIIHVIRITNALKIRHSQHWTTLMGLFFKSLCCLIIIFVSISTKHTYKFVKIK